MTINKTKTTKYFILVLTVLFTSCKGQNQKFNPAQKSKAPIAIIQENEKKATEKKSENIGELVSTISFKVKTDNKKDYEDGLIPWANIEKAKPTFLPYTKKTKLLLRRIQ